MCDWNCSKNRATSRPAADYDSSAALDEQRRIVAKVDELMALCDRQEASLATGDDTRRHLLDALLAEALTPTEAAMQAEAPSVAAHG